MIHSIIFIGQLLVGLIACVLIFMFLVAFGIELYDRFTGADEKKQQMQARLKSVEEDHT